LQGVPISDCWREAKSSGEEIMKKGRIWDGERERRKGGSGGGGGEPEDQHARIERWASSCPSDRPGLLPSPLADPSLPSPLGSHPQPCFPTDSFSSPRQFQKDPQKELPW